MENHLLQEELRGRRIRFTDAERALLARKAKAVGRKALLELETIVSPDTLLRWHRRLVARKWNFVERRGVGRRGIMRHLSELIVRMAQENPSWGYTRIQGALANLTFLRAHWRVLAASDFLTVEVWTGRGLVTHYLLFMISFADRVVKVAGITTRPDEPWMLQIARNETDSQAGVLHAKRYLIIDRDSKYSDQFRRLIRDSGTMAIRLPPMSPNLNAYAERFVRSIKEECLNRMIFIGQASLRRALAEYLEAASHGWGITITPLEYGPHAPQLTTRSTSLDSSVNFTGIRTSHAFRSLARDHAQCKSGPITAAIGPIGG